MVPGISFWALCPKPCPCIHGETLKEPQTGTRLPGRVVEFTCGQAASQNPGLQVDSEQAARGNGRDATFHGEEGMLRVPPTLRLPLRLSLPCCLSDIHTNGVLSSF